MAAGVTPRFGDADEVKSRDALRTEIEDLRDALKSAQTGQVGIGHNQPPGSLSLSVELTVEVSQAVDEIDAEVSKPDPNVESVVRSAGRLEKVVGWIGRKLDITVDAFLARIGSAGAVAAIGGAVALSPVGERLLELFRAALTWLATVTLTF